jgi:RHS repeat-associated protein
LQFDGQGTLTHRYLHGPAVDQILADEDAVGQVRWALTDNLGSVRELVDSAGTVLNHIVYDSFGRIASETNAGTDFLFAYTGRELDRETGLQYNRARYFDPAVSVFVSEDPAFFRGNDVNLYRYVGNGPTNRTDPTGLKGWNRFSRDLQVSSQRAWWDSIIPDAVVLSLSGAAAFIPLPGPFWGATGGGYEMVYIFGHGWEVYEQTGPGFGVGGGVSAEVGFIWNLENPQDYTGPGTVEYQVSGSWVLGPAGSFSLSPSSGAWGVKGGLSLGTPSVAVLMEGYEFANDWWNDQGSNTDCLDQVGDRVEKLVVPIVPRIPPRKHPAHNGFPQNGFQYDF